jgi:hypothetical protein
LVFARGIELWVFGYRFGSGGCPFTTRRATCGSRRSPSKWLLPSPRPELATADWRDHLRGAVARRAL